MRLRTVAAGPAHRPVLAVVRPPVVALLLALTGCSAGQSPVEACVEHSLEEGIDRAAAEAACEDVVDQ